MRGSVYGELALLALAGADHAAVWLVVDEGGDVLLVNAVDVGAHARSNECIVYVLLNVVETAKDV